MTVRFLSITAVIVALTGCRSVEPQGRTSTTLPHLVWAHYTAWHSPENTAVATARYYNFPSQPTTGDTQADLRREIELAQASGINGFFVDAVAREGAPTGYFPQIGALLKAAEGTDFRIGPCLDQCVSVDWQVKELARFVELHGAHPNLARVGNRPVIATYSFGCHTPDEWQAIRNGLAKQGIDIFLIGNLNSGYTPPSPERAAAYAKVSDMLYSFGEYGIHGTSIKQTFDIFATAAKDQGAAWMPVIHPGYLGGWFNGRNDYYQPYRGFDQFLDCWQAIVPDRAAWVHLTTWNDLDETPLLPTIWDFSTYSELNRALAQRWRGEPWATKEPAIYFAYHREELLGTVWRLQALALPRQQQGYVELDIALTTPDGRVLQELPTQALSLRDLSTTEWAVPTAPFAAELAVVPRVTMTLVQDGQRRPPLVRNLPALLPVLGWLQNQTTLRVPLHKMATGDAQLTVRQQGPLLSARVEAAGSDPIRHAALYRNDRPIALLGYGDATFVTLHIAFADNPNLQVDLADGQLIDVQRKFGGAPPQFQWDAHQITTRDNRPWYPLDLTIAGGLETRLSLTLNKNAPVVLTIAELLAQHQITIGKRPHQVIVMQSEIDPRLLASPAVSPKAPLTASLLTRDSHPQDRFYARLETTSSHVLFTPIIAPFAGSELRPVRILQTAVNLETPSGATGRPGGRDFNDVPPFLTPQAAEVQAHPALFRAGAWDFTEGGWDSLGERPFATNKAMPWMQGPKVVQDRSLVLNGATSVGFRRRAYPMGACTLAFDLFPVGERTAQQAILTRSGWTSAFNFYLEPDGRLRIVRDGKVLTPTTVFTSKIAIPPDHWTQIRLTFDGQTARLYINSQLDAEAAIPLTIEYGNCTAVLGASENGFSGKVDNVRFLSWPEPPPAQHSPD